MSQTKAHSLINFPDDFTFLSSIDPSIQEDVRYFGSENFLGCPVEGYTLNKIICTHQAGEALKQAQAFFKRAGYGLVVYDGYRPQRAVNHFCRWSEDHEDQKRKAHYYPTIEKKEAFSLGFIAKKSTHSRGSTFDLTLIPLGQQIKEVTIHSRILKTGEIIPFLDDGTLDMGSSFDLFHSASHHDAVEVSEDFLIRRNLLKEGMEKAGFEKYQKEWWHYRLKDEPHKETYFDWVP